VDAQWHFISTAKPRKTMKLFPHQEQAKQFLLAQKRAILADQPRVGKTLPTTAAALENLPALIVCPAIAKTVWEAAFNKLAPDVSVRVISGRNDAMKTTSDKVVIVNYDLLQYFNNAGFQTLVLDECHRIKNPKAARTKAAMLLMKQIPQVYALSGTPMSNRPAEMWPVLHGLGIYRGGWFDFVYRYAKAWNPPWGGLDVSGASNIPELKALMKPYVLRRKKEDIFMNYQEPQVSLITFDLAVDKREQEFDADALMANPNALLAFEGLSEVMKEAGIRKAPLAADFIDDLLHAGEPVVVFAHHKEVVNILEDELRTHKPVKVVGDTPKAQRQKNIEAFQSGKTKCFIGNIASCSEGIDLSVADTIVFVEPTWQTSALEQASSRVENIQKNGTKPLIYLLTVRASLDHNILKRVIEKQNIINQII
jgi:SWI/SNF-related matrix-associated actin-dependent regulator 1 of chromatin subfamily A